MDYELMMNGNVKIGTYAPDFEAETTMGKIELNQYKGKWVILFSHRGITYTEKYRIELNALYYRCFVFLIK